MNNNGADNGGNLLPIECSHAYTPAMDRPARIAKEHSGRWQAKFMKDIHSRNIGVRLLARMFGLSESSVRKILKKPDDFIFDATPTNPAVLTTLCTSDDPVDSHWISSRVFMEPFKREQAANECFFLDAAPYKGKLRPGLILRLPKDGKPARSFDALEQFFTK